MLSIIIAILTFLLAKSKGMSTGKAALIGAAAGGIAYATIDPSNESRLLFNSTDGDSGDDRITSGDIDNGSNSSVASVATEALRQVGDTARSFGPDGIVKTSAGLAAVSTTKSVLKDHPWILLALGVGALYLILKD